MEQQQNMMVHSSWTSADICFCDNCKFVKNVIIQQLRTASFMGNRLSNEELITVILEHITEHKSVLNASILRIQIYTNRCLNATVQYIIKMAKRNLTVMLLSVIARQKFTNEIMFYKTFASRFTTTIFAQCYILDTVLSQVSILILQNLTADGYRQFKSKFTAAILTRCIKALAWFHANAAKLINENAAFKSYVTQLEVQYYEKLKQLQAVRMFLNNSLIKTVSNDLQEKIKQKLKKAQEHLIMNRKLSILIHGSLTRSKIFFKETGDNEAVKFIDFQTVNVGSPGIDLSRLLFTNLPNIRKVEKLEKFCRKILDCYMSTFMTEYPSFDSRGCLYQDIINNLIYSYVNLDETEKKEIQNHVTIMEVLNKLGSLD